MLRIEDVNPVWLVSLVVALLVPVLLLRSSQQKQRAKQLLGSSTPVLWSTAEGISLPFIGQGITFLLYAPWDLLTRWHERYGGVICFPLLGTTMFSVTDAQMCKAVLQSSTANIKKDIEVTMKPFLSILGTGIVTSEGSHWLKQRRKMSHPLREDILEIIPSQTLSAVQRLMTILDEAIEKGEQERVPLGSLLRHLTLQVISGSFLSLSAQESDSTFAKLYLPIVDESNKRVWHSYRSYCFFLPAFWKYHSNVYQLNAYVSSLIRQRWELRRREQKETAATASSTISSSGRSFDILDKVLADFEKEFPNHTDDTLPEHAVRQFRDEMKTFMLAGHETSAAMMTWCLYEFIHNSKLCADVVREAEGVFDPAVDWRRAPSSDIPPADQLAKLQLSEASLRVRYLLGLLIWFGRRMDCLCLFACLLGRFLGTGWVPSRGTRSINSLK